MCRNECNQSSQQDGLPNNAAHPTALPVNTKGGLCSVKVRGVDSCPRAEEVFSSVYYPVKKNQLASIHEIYFGDQIHGAEGFVLLTWRQRAA